jgi:hypothetical protein
MWMSSLFSLRQSRCARRGAKRCRAVQYASFRPCGAGVYHQQLRMAVQCYSELYGRLFRSCSDVVTVSETQLGGSGTLLPRSGLPRRTETNDAAVRFPYGWSCDLSRGGSRVLRLGGRCVRGRSVGDPIGEQQAVSCRGRGCIFGGQSARLFIQIRA